MKKTFAFMLGLAVLAGCSKVDSQTEGGNAITGDNGLVPITLGGLDIISKATTKSGPIENQAFTAGIAGWESKTAPDYTTATSEWEATLEIAETSRTVTWTEQQYYHADNAIKTYMKAWYPEGTYNKSDKTVSFENTLGDVDVLLAPVVSGSKGDTETETEGKRLEFVHMTSQLVFKVVAENSLAADTKIKSIKIKDAQLPVGIDLKLDKDADGAVTYEAAPSDWTVPGIDGSQNISTSATAAGKPVMIKPMGTTALTLDVETSTAKFENINVTIDGGNMEKGTAYTVTLTFKQKEITITASVAPWKQGTGSAEID